MTISQTAVVKPFAATGSEITSAHLGINIALGFERFGTLPWEKFDEIHAQIGTQSIRFPGGSEAETLFSYANPDATVAVTADGTIRQLITPDKFLDYCAATDSKATIVLPVRQLLTDANYSLRDFDASKADEVRAYVRDLLEKAGPEGIGTFELGNEYAGFMTATEYGKVASALALIVGQEIADYYGAHPGHDTDQPLVAVQSWGQSTGGSLSLADLMARSQTVMAQFSAAELAAITAVTDHFYYYEGINPGEENFHSYSNIAASIGYSLDIMAAWNTLTGRSLETIVSEWNVNFRDARNYGLQQAPILLEMFTSFVAGGVDELDMWSTMYNATAIGNYQGELQTAGTLLQIMSQTLIGTKATEVAVTSPNFDIHAFSGQGRAVLFVSSLIDQAMSLELDLSAYLDRYDLKSARLMQVDMTSADGVYQGTSGLLPWEEADAGIVLTPQNLAALLQSGMLLQFLGAHETLILEFTQERTQWGTMATDFIRGLEQSDRIDSLGSNDKIFGMFGNDSLFGNVGNDTIRGGEGMDRIFGGVGSDSLYGAFGNDTIEGKANNDQIFGGTGDDFIAGGDSSDTLWGGEGADGFMFHELDSGMDILKDFSANEGDYLIFDGSTPINRSDFVIEVRSVLGIGDAALADLVVRISGGGPILWVFEDLTSLSSLTIMDADTGSLIALI